jgi:tripartite-type tricarboxylate transporter receptor subunit TctC
VRAVTTRNRNPELPDVPGFIGSGYPRIEVESCHGIVVRSGTPGEIVERIARETAIAMRRPEVQERFRAPGVRGIGSMPDAFAAFFNDEMVKWGAVIRAAGIRAEQRFSRR